MILILLLEHYTSENHFIITAVILSEYFVSVCTYYEHGIYIFTTGIIIGCGNVFIIKWYFFLL